MSTHSAPPEESAPRNSQTLLERAYGFIRLYGWTNYRKLNAGVGAIGADEALELAYKFGDYAEADYTEALETFQWVIGRSNIGEWNDERYFGATVRRAFRKAIALENGR